MAAPRFDQSACDQLANCVREIEAETDAEIVIVVRARSGSYRAADLIAGTILAFVTLLFLVFSPFSFHEYWIPLDAALLFAVGLYVSSRSSSLRRLLTRAKLRNQWVRTYAAAMFYEAGIANTQAEMGLLIYLSLLEKRLEVIADRGILTALPPLEWNAAVGNLTKAGEDPDLQTLVQNLNDLGKLLARHLPATGENPNELPDMPRFDLT
jgi:putative membrane protein